MLIKRPFAQFWSRVAHNYCNTLSAQFRRRIICAWLWQAGLKLAKAYKAAGGIAKLFGVHLPGAAGMKWVAEVENKVQCHCHAHVWPAPFAMVILSLSRLLPSTFATRTAQIVGKGPHVTDCEFQCVRKAVAREPGLPAEQPMVRVSIGRHYELWNGSRDSDCDKCLA